MVATVKCDTITEASNTGTANLSLSSTGNVTIGNNLTVTGTTTQTGSTTFTGPTYFPNGSVSAPSIAHTGDTNCGLYFGTDTIYAATAGTNALTIDSSQNMTVANTLVMGSSFKRNKIINGDMRVDQRNAGASVTSISATYIVDRWMAFDSVGSKFTAQQNAGSVTPPVGFTNYLGATSTSSYSITSSDQFNFQQRIEGFNVSDLAWGTANAKTITVSFWVYSSLTGTFGGSILGASTRSYPFDYTISSSNTWTYITKTIPGDTSGTWNTNNGVGLRIYFSLGTGSTNSAASGSWLAGSYQSVTGATSVVGTNGATFYITGVQLEVGSVATPYERQIYSDQLIQCQRYFSKSYLDGVTPGTSTNTGKNSWVSMGTVSTFMRYSQPFPVTMRAAPTTVAIYSTTGASGNVRLNNASDFAVTTEDAGALAFAFYGNRSWTAGDFVWWQWTASAEL